MAVAQPQRRPRIGFHALCVDALMDDRNQGAKSPRQQSGLEWRRADNSVGVSIGQRQSRVLGVHPKTFVGRRLAKFGIEADVHSARMVIEFGINNLLRVRKNFLQEQRFAPARMANNDGGAETLLIERERTVSRRPAPYQVSLGAGGGRKDPN